MRFLIYLLTLPLFFSCAHNTQSHTYLYEHQGQVLEGEIYLPAGSAKRPGVIVYHAWKGPNAQTARVARELSEQGYVAFVADIYGQGIRPKTNEEASERASFYRQRRPLLRSRARSALNEMLQHPRVDKENISAIGFCFGGGTVLEMARDAAPLKNVISFHGNLDTPNSDDAANITARVLILHGGVDPLVPKAQVDAFHQEMDAAKVDYTFVSFGGAVHSFSDPNAGSDPSTGVAYDENAAKRSFEIMHLWLQEE
jgi:dienelactone hydrolase